MCSKPGDAEEKMAVQANYTEAPAAFCEKWWMNEWIQANLVERALTGNNEQGAVYGRLAYLQALKDLLYLEQGVL